jgi:hypothetical protein
MPLVYRHRRKDTNTVFYVGISNSINRPYSKRNRNFYWHNIVKKYGYDVEILYDDLTYDEAFELEIFLISIYGRKDLGTGILCNMTNGGDGRQNILVSKETRLKLSEKGKRDDKKIHYLNEVTPGRRKTKVIDTKTNIIYDTIIEASIVANISLRHFKRCLYGERPNYTTFELLNEKTKHRCRKKQNPN